MNHSRKYSPEPSLRLNKSKSTLSRANSFVLTKQIQKNYLQQQKNPKYEKIRLQIKKFFASTFLGRCYVNGLQILTVVSVLQFILQTYIESTHQKFYQTLITIELCIASLFAFDWCLGLFLQPRWDYVSSFYSLVDICIVIPVYLCYFLFTQPVYFEEIVTVYDAFNTFFHCGRSLLLVRILRLQRNILFIQDDIHRHLCQIGLTILAILLFDTGILQYLETTADGDTHEFHLWMYYMVMSVSTVGYDRISPRTIPGKLVSVTAVCFLLIFIPDQAQKIWEKMNRLSKYLRSRYSPSRNSQHIVICGDISSVNMREFIEELYHEDHTSNLVLTAVILNPGDPSPEIYSLLIDPYFSLFLRYLNGSPLVSHDLQRVAIESSSAVFLLSNKFTITPESEDAKRILQFASIRRYVTIYHNPLVTPDPPLYCIQLIQPGSKSLVKLHDPDGGTELVICLSEIKTSLMSMSAIFPGSCTLLFNLLTAYSDSDTATTTDMTFATPLSPHTQPSDGTTTTTTAAAAAAGIGKTGIGKTGKGKGKGARAKAIGRKNLQKSGLSFGNLFKKWRVLSSYQVGDGDSSSSDEDEEDEEDQDGEEKAGKEEEEGDGEDDPKRLQEKRSKIPSDPPFKNSPSLSASASASLSVSVSTEPRRKTSLNRQGTPLLSDWFAEYKSGYEWEIYLVQLGTGYRGQKFVNIVLKIYQELGVILFALRVKDVTGLTHASVMINPYQYTIPMSRNVIIEGFIIAKDRHSANVMAHIANSFSMGSPNPLDQRSGGGGRGGTEKTTGAGAAAASSSLRRRENICITPTMGVRGRGGGGGGGGGGQERRHLRDILYPQSAATGGPHSILNAASAASENKGIEYEERQLQEEIIFHQLYYTTHSFFSSSAAPALAPAATASIFDSPHPSVSPLTPAPAPAPAPRLEQMLISSSLLLEFPLVKNHIVLITKETGIKYLYDFIKPLRRRYLGRCIDILILSPVPLSQEIFNSISVFQGIYWIIGSPLKVLDLRRAGIYRASQCVILADFTHSSSSSNFYTSSQTDCSTSSFSSNSNSSSSSSATSVSEEHTLADAESIFIYHSIKRENPSLNVLVEIIQSENVKFLESSSHEFQYQQQRNPRSHGSDAATAAAAEESYDYHLSSNFANGSLFMSSIVDALVPQAFYNPHLIVIINKLLGNDLSHTAHTSPTYTASTIPLHETSLVQISLPEEFIGKTYQELFHSFLFKGILSIGLYRQKLQRARAGTRGGGGAGGGRGNSEQEEEEEDKYASTNHRPRSEPILFSYVYTNPHPEEILTKLDRVYVLTDQQILKPHLFTSQDFIDTVTSLRKQSHLLQKLSSISASTPSPVASSHQKPFQKSTSQLSQDQDHSEEMSNSLRRILETTPSSSPAVAAESSLNSVVKISEFEEDEDEEKEQLQREKKTQARGDRRRKMEEGETEEEIEKGEVVVITKEEKDHNRHRGGGGGGGGGGERC